jgi:hypothetical protein
VRSSLSPALYRLLATAPFVGAAVLILLTVSNDLIQAGTLDPFVYTGLIHDYVDVTTRHPSSYYATRLAHILPSALAALVLGDDFGYYAVRLVQLTAALASIHVIARHYGNASAAWLVTAFFGTHVWLLRTMLWDMYDGTVVVLSLAGIACLLRRVTHSRAFHFAAGFAFAWAANCNPVALAIATAYAPAWLLDHAGRPRHAKLADAATSFVGVAIGYLVLIVAMLLVSPESTWKFDRASWRMATWMLEGGAKNWFMPLSEILARRNYQVLMFPFFVGAACIPVLFGDRSNGVARARARGALAFVVSLTAMFAFMHFAISSGVLSLFYYLSYVIPAGVVVLAALWADWQPTDRRIAVVAAVLLGLAQITCWYATFRLQQFHLPTTLALSATGCIGLVVLALALRGRWRMTAPIAVVSIMLASNVFFIHGGLTAIYGDSSRRIVEWDVRRGAIHLVRFMAEHVPPAKGPARFWYGTRDAYLNSVQGAYLWGLSRLSEPIPGKAQMPDLDDGVRERLEALKFVAILGNHEELERASKALKDAGFDVAVVERGTFRGRAWEGYEILVLEVASGRAAR